MRPGESTNSRFAGRPDPPAVQSCIAQTPSHNDDSSGGLHVREAEQKLV
jgi:hypothetical protein